MSASDAYASSGGWGGGSAALSPGGALTSYYQKLQAVNPQSGSMSVAQPAQSTTQPSSLSRVAATSQGTTAQPTVAQPAQPAQAVAMPAVAAVPTIATAVPTVASVPMAGMSRVKASIQTPFRGVAAPTLGGALSEADQRAQDAAGALPRFSGPLTKVAQVGNYVVRLHWNNVAKRYEYDKMNPRSMIYDNTSANAAYSRQTGSPLADEGWLLRDNAGAQAAIQQAIASVNGADDVKNAVAAYNIAQKAYGDKLNAYQAQGEAEQATAFNLAGALQAPNTSAVDQAGANDLARVQSQYASGLGGVDAAAYNYAGQGAQATQQAVNAVNHNTAYANAFNQNYSTFANALAAQQTANANASGQKLSYDIEGIGQAVQMLQQQASQLSQNAQTQVNAQLIPLQNQLAQYQLALKQYGASSNQAMTIAKGIMSMAGSLVSGLV